MYRILRNILFLFPPEAAHYFSMNALKFFCRTGFRKFIASRFAPARFSKKWILGELEFRNPVGLGAGFDKNAKWLAELETLGFGFAEIGTVTPLPQAGNEKPRLFRLPTDSALVNRMGFNNDGVKRIAERLRQWKMKTHHAGEPRLIIGGNIGKNKTTANEDAWKDYEICFRELHDLVDYFVVNVSSPNTPGLRELQEKESLRKILGHLSAINGQLPDKKPLLLKISPDLTSQQLDDIIALAMEIKLDGLVAANTSIDREGLQTKRKRIARIGNGGLSGVPLKKKTTEMVRYIFERTKGQIPIIASGGIFTGKDALEKLAAGAVLVQVWTGFIYEGPAIAKNICRQIRQE